MNEIKAFIKEAVHSGSVAFLPCKDTAFIPLEDRTFKAPSWNQRTDLIKCRNFNL
jgi:hypothetical protein